VRPELLIYILKRDEEHPSPLNFSYGSYPPPPLLLGSDYHVLLAWFFFLIICLSVWFAGRAIVCPRTEFGHPAMIGLKITPASYNGTELPLRECRETSLFSQTFRNKRKNIDILVITIISVVLFVRFSHILLNNKT